MPLIVFGVLTVVGYDWDKPWLMWRTKTGPLPRWVYLIVVVCLGVVLIVTAANG